MSEKKQQPSHWYNFGLGRVPFYPIADEHQQRMHEIHDRLERDLAQAWRQQKHIDNLKRQCGVTERKD